MFLLNLYRLSFWIFIFIIKLFRNLCMRNVIIFIFLTFDSTFFLKTFLCVLSLFCYHFLSLTAIPSSFYWLNRHTFKDFLPIGFRFWSFVNRFSFWMLFQRSNSLNYFHFVIHYSYVLNAKSVFLLIQDLAKLTLF